MKNKVVRIEKNIEYLEENPLQYRTIVTRDHQRITESYETLEEAISARDEIKANYLETGKLEHSSFYEWGRLKTARRNYRSDVIKNAVDRQGKVCYSIDAVCKQCNRKLTYYVSDLYRRFIDRDQRCNSCFIKDRHDDLCDIKNSNNRPYSTNRTTGVKNVSFNRSLNTYCVAINRKNNRIFRYANTLDKAITIKERILDFYKEFDRLPNVDEI